MWHRLFPSRHLPHRALKTVAKETKILSLEGTRFVYVTLLPGFDSLPWSWTPKKMTNQETSSDNWDQDLLKENHVQNFSFALKIKFLGRHWWQQDTISELVQIILKDTMKHHDRVSYFANYRNSCKSLHHLFAVSLLVLVIIHLGNGRYINIKTPQQSRIDRRKIFFLGTSASTSFHQIFFLCLFLYGACKCFLKIMLYELHQKRMLT